MHRAIALAGAIELLKKVRPQIVVLLLVAQEMIDDDQQTVTDGDDGAFLADATSQAVILGREVVVPGMGDDPDTLGQDGPQMPIALVGGRFEALAPTLFVAWRNPRPGGQM